MARLGYEEFVSDLPKCPGPTGLPVDPSVDGFAYVVDGLEDFVPPDLAKRVDAGGCGRPAVIVVSAAGAVGKSTLAKEIAREHAAPLWDLATEGPVGQHTVGGALGTTFGYDKMDQVRQSLGAGRLFLVIDALDEARVKVNEASYEAFVKDLAHLAKEGQGPCLLLVGRTQIAETTWLLLAEAGVETALYTIEPFSRDQADQYIKGKVTTVGGPGYKAMEAHPGPFEEARDLLLDQLRRAIDGEVGTEPSQATREFLGYAPVLDAISILLAGEGNPRRLREELEGAVAQFGSEDGRGPAGLLDRVIRWILEREQKEKLAKNIKPALEPLASQHRWSSWDLLYSQDEQCRRLVGQICSTENSIPVEMPCDLRAKYEEQVQISLPEHPFLRDGRYPANVVFESYLYAAATANEYGDARTVVHGRLSDPAFKPSRLFADFYLLFRERDGGGLVPVEHIGWLYDSILSAESGTLTVRLSIDGPEPEHADPTGEPADIEVEFDLRSPDGADGAPCRDQAVKCRASVRPTDTLALTRYVRDAAITVPCSVALGTSGQEFQIGPAVSIACRELSIRGSGLVVGGLMRPRNAEDEDYDPAVILEALAFRGMINQKPEVRVPLRVTWPGATAYPWTDFYRPVAPAIGNGGDLHQAYRRFRRIVMTLQSGKRGGLAKTRHKVEHARVLQGAMGDALLARLVNDAILRLEDGRYHWVPERASVLVGISWMELRQNEASIQLTEYLQSFLEGFTAGR